MIATRLLPIALAAALAAAEPIPVPAPSPVPAPAASAPAPAWLGVGLDEVDEAVAYHLKLENDLGVIITQVAPGSPAERLGLRQHDVVVEADHQPIYTPRAFSALIRAKKPGEVVDLVVRRGAERTGLSGPLGVAPPRPAAFAPPGLPGQPGSGPMGEEIRRFLEEHRARRRPGPDGKQPDLPRSGRVETPDGGVMEWNLMEPEKEKKDNAF